MHSLGADRDNEDVHRTDARTIAITPAAKDRLASSPRWRVKRARDVNGQITRISQCRDKDRE